MSKFENVIKFEVGENICFFKNFDEDFYPIIQSVIYGERYDCINPIYGKIEEIHIRKNSIYCDINVYDIYGNVVEIVKDIPQNNVFHTKEEAEKFFKNCLVAELNEICENIKKFMGDQNE